MIAKPRTLQTQVCTASSYSGISRCLLTALHFVLTPQYTHSSIPPTLCSDVTLHFTPRHTSSAPPSHPFRPRRLPKLSFAPMSPPSKSRTRPLPTATAATMPPAASNDLPAPHPHHCSFHLWPPRPHFHHTLRCPPPPTSSTRSTPTPTRRPAYPRVKPPETHSHHDSAQPQPHPHHHLTPSCNKPELPKPHSNHFACATLRPHRHPHPLQTPCLLQTHRPSTPPHPPTTPTTPSLPPSSCIPPLCIAITTSCPPTCSIPTIPYSTHAHPHPIPFPVRLSPYSPSRARQITNLANLQLDLAQPHL